MTQRLPGIIAISYTPCSSLIPLLMEMALNNVPVSHFTDPTPLSLIGDGECEAETSREDGGMLQKTKLVFLTTDDIPDTEPLVFIVKDVVGDTYLIGTREKPHPIVEVTKTIDADKNITSVKVEFEAKISLIRCS